MGELQLGLLSVIHREPLHQQGGEARASSPAKAVENQEALVIQLVNPVQDKVKDLLANGIVATGIVICSIFLACDELSCSG